MKRCVNSVRQQNEDLPHTDPAWRKSNNKSGKRGVTPSTPPLGLCSRSEDAKARATAQPRIPAQRILQACSTRRRIKALWRLPTMSKMLQSRLTTCHQLPVPTQPTLLHYADPQALATSRDHCCAIPGCGARSGGSVTMVSCDQCGVNCELSSPKNRETLGDDLQTSCVVHIRSWQVQITYTLGETRAPTSRQILAPALSNANPRLPNTPARWWPKESSGHH